MWKCPICSNEEKSEYKCQMCGYDVRKDFVRNRTVQHVPPQDVKDFVKRISDHDEAERQKAAEAARVLLEVIKREQEKKAEVERLAKEAAARKAEEERRAREAEAARKAEEERKAREAEAARREEESRARAAEAARRSAEMARKEAEERQKVWQTYTENSQKKSSKGLKWVARCLLFLGVFGAIGAVVGTMADNEKSKGLYSSYQSEYNSVEEAWDYIFQELKGSLELGTINYETDSMDVISNFWNSMGYEVNVDPMVYNEEYDNISGNVYGDDGFTYLNCYDVKYADSFDRNLTFSYYQDQIPNGSLNNVMPLPFGIQFGDSYQKVYEKLGLTEEMVAYVTDEVSNNLIFLYLDEPGSEYVSISVYVKNYYFAFFFNDETYELLTFCVGVYTHNQESEYTETYSETSEYTSNDWELIVQTSIDALQHGAIDYIGDSHENVENKLLDQGFEKDYSNTTIDYKSKHFKLGNDRYVIRIQDGYELFNPEYRSLSFVYYPQFGENLDGTLKPVFLKNVPLPYGITFDDSFDTVCGKLGITEDMIFEAENMENLYVVVQAPDNDQEDVGYSIIIYYTSASGEQYDFTYYFSGDGSYLTDYLVWISC